MSIKVNTEHAEHKWVTVEFDDCEISIGGMTNTGDEDDHALYVLFEQIEAMQAEHAKQLEAAYFDGGTRDCCHRIGFALPEATWKFSKTYALIHKDNQ